MNTNVQLSPSPPFRSILFERPRAEEGTQEPPGFFADLNLDQILSSVVSGREEYDLRSFFCTPLKDVADVAYRHDVLRDLEGHELRANTETFAKGMREMRQHLAQSEKLYHEYQKASWFLDAVEIYCDAVRSLADALSHADAKSRGVLSFRDYLEAYVDSQSFASLTADTKEVKDRLASITYTVGILGRRVTVRKSRREPDYSAEVEETFLKFKQGAVHDYRVKFRNPPEMNSVEERILDLVARLYPDEFLALRDYRSRYKDFLDATVARFDREVQFYLAYLELVARLKAVGLKFCYPRVSAQSKAVEAKETFDLALAIKLTQEGSTVVCNDLQLKGRERIFVVSGANQGGKTTFARTFGQLHYLASLGYPVPGSEASLFLCDRLFTHFEREEHIENLRGKLQDELVRIREILDQATSNSILITNESFSSTTLRDSLFLGREIMRQIIQRDMLCVYVTFIDELSSAGESTVSMVSTVVPGNPAQRTYKIIRKPADGRAYATAIAEKHGLDYESLRKRIAR